MFRTLNAHVPWIFMMAVITFQSSMSNLKLPDLGFNFVDKLMHLLVFGVLGWLITRGILKCSTDLCQKRYFILVMFIGGTFAFLDEWHQSTVPGRSADLKDWFADMTGIIIFTLYYKWKSLRTVKV